MELASDGISHFTVRMMCLKRGYRQSERSCRLVSVFCVIPVCDDVPGEIRRCGSHLCDELLSQMFFDPTEE